MWRRILGLDLIKHGETPSDYNRSVSHEEDLTQVSVKFNPCPDLKQEIPEKPGKSQTIEDLGPEALS